MPPRKIAPSPNSKANPKPNNFPDTILTSRKRTK